MKIRTLIILVFFLVAVILYALGSTYLYSQQSSILLASAEQSITLIVDSKSSQVSSWVSSMDDSFNVNSTSIVFQDYLEADPADPELHEKFLRMHRRIDSIMGLPSVEQIIILDPQGKVAGSSDKSILGQDYSGSDFFIDGQSSLKRFGPIIGGKEKLVIRLAGPIVSDYGDYLGVFVMETNMNFVNDLLADRAGLGETGEVYLTDGKGYLISPFTGYSMKDLLVEKIESKSVEECINDYKEHSVPGSDIAAHSEKVISELSGGGEPVFTAHAYVPEMEWCLVAQISQEEIFGVYLSGILLSNAIGGIVLVFLAVFVSVFLARRIGNPIIRLSEGVNGIMGGKLDTKLESSSISEVNDLTINLNRVLVSLKIAIQKIGVNPEDIGLGEAIAAKKEAEAKARQYFDLAANLLVVLDRDGNIASINKKGYEILGYEEGSLVGKNWFDVVIRKEERKKIKEVFAGVTKGDVDVSHYKNFVQRKDGSLRNIEWFNTVVRDDSGALLNIVSSGIDITDSEKAAEAIKESEEKYRLISENTGDFIAMLSFNLKPKFIYVSPSFKHFGYAPSELLGKEATQYLHPEDKKKLIPLLKKYFFNRALVGESLERELGEKLRLRFLGKGGEWFLLESTVNIAGSSMIFVSKDISESITHAEELKESEKKFRFLFESSRDSIMTLAPPEWKFTKANSATIAMFGCGTEEKFSSMQPWQLSPEYQPDGQRSDVKAKKMIKKAMKEGRNFFNWAHKKCTGEEFAATILLSRVGEGKEAYLQATVRDVSEEMRAKELLKESEEKFRLISEGTSDLVAVTSFEPASKYIYVSPSHKTVLGYDSDDLVGKSAFEIMHPDDRPAVTGLLKNYLKKRIFGKLENAHEDLIRYRVKRKDGAWVTLESSASLVKGRIVLISRDVTRNLSEKEAMRLSEEKYRMLYSSMSEGVALHELVRDKKGRAVDYRILDCNPAFTKHTGLSRQNAVGKLASEAYKTAPPFLGKYADVAESGNPIYFEEYFEPMKKHFGISVFSPMKGQFATVFQDITESKAMGDAMRVREEFSENVLNSISDGIDIVDKDCRILFMNKAFLSVFGKGAIGKKCYEVYKIDKKQCDNCPLRKHIEIGKTRTIEVPGIVGNRTFLVSHTGIMQADGSKAVLESFKDITGIRERERALKASEEKYRLLFDTTQDGIILIDADTKKVVDINKTMIDLVKYPKEEIVGKALWELAPLKETGASKVAFELLQKKKYKRPNTLPLKTKTGNIIQVEFVSNEYDIAGKRIIRCNIREQASEKAAKKRQE